MCMKKLERLLEKDDLISGMPYDNSGLNPDYFFDFVRRYGEMLGLRTLITKIGMCKTTKLHYDEVGRLVGEVFKGKFSFLLTDLTNLVDSILGVTLYPLLYPVIGGTISSVYQLDKGEVGKLLGVEVSEEGGKEEGGVLVILPKYRGVRKFVRDSSEISDCVHEYHHAYHYFLSRDLKKRKIINCVDGYNDIDVEKITPFFNKSKAPSYEELRNFERKIILEMLNTESFVR